MFCCIIYSFILLITLIISFICSFIAEISPYGDIRGGSEVIWKDMVENPGDGIETAQSLFGKSIKQTSCNIVSSSEFDSMGVLNHRAKLNASLNDMFPEDDRPRGDADISAVNFFTTTREPIDPIMVLNHNDKLYVLDGVHRLIAAYLTDSPIIRICIGVIIIYQRIGLLSYNIFCHNIIISLKL